VQVNQVADEAEAKRDAVGQQVQPRLAHRRLLGHFADPFGAEPVADNFARVGQVTPVLAAHGHHDRGDDAADEDGHGEGPPDDAKGGPEPEEGADPGAEAHLHLDVARPHAADGVDRQQQGEAENGPGQGGAEAPVAAAGQQPAVVQQAESPTAEDQRQRQPVGHLELPAVDDGGDHHRRTHEQQRPVGQREQRHAMTSSAGGDHEVSFLD